jgi:hypothetical protein
MAATTGLAIVDELLQRQEILHAVFFGRGGRLGVLVPRGFLFFSFLFFLLQLGCCFLGALGFYLFIYSPDGSFFASP